MVTSKLCKSIAVGVIAVSGLMLSACSTSPRIHSVYEQGVDFSKYDTFSFFQNHEPKGEEYLSLNDKYLRQAITQELTARGLRESETPDLLVGFNISTKEKISSTTYPAGPLGYYGYRSRYGYTYGLGYGSDTRVNQYTEGTLNIDVVDREQKQLVWEGVAVGRLKDKPSENLKKEVFDVVSAIFNKFPVAEKGAK